MLWDVTFPDLGLPSDYKIRIFTLYLAHTSMALSHHSDESGVGGAAESRTDRIGPSRK